MIGGKQSRHGYRLINAGENTVKKFSIELDHHRFFCGIANANHCFNRLYRVAAGCRFSRQHHRIRSVEHGIGHVGYFGARGRWRVDHRFHHLRGGDGQFVLFASQADHAFLQRGHGGITHFDSEVAAGDHQAIRGFEDFFKGCDSLDPLDFCDGQGVAATGEH